MISLNHCRICLPCRWSSKSALAVCSSSSRRTATPKAGNMARLSQNTTNYCSAINKEKQRWRAMHTASTVYSLGNV